MSRILLTGVNGQVGFELQRTLAPLGEVIALTRQEMDLADPASIHCGIRSISTDDYCQSRSLYSS